MEQPIVTAYFDSLPATRKAERNCLKIISLLNKHGCNVTQTVIGTELSYTEIQGPKAATNIYSLKLKDIQKADIFVCEMSNLSPTLAIEVWEALRLLKPTLVLYFEQSSSRPDTAFLGSPSKLLTVEIYNKNDLEEKIKRFLKKAQRRIVGNRFTVRLTKEMNEYLEFLKVKLRCSSKNEVVMKILERLINEDYDFQKIKEEAE